MNSLEKPLALKIIAEEGFMPVRAHTWDAGLDLRCKLDDQHKGSVTIYPECEVKVGTGVKVAIPEGYVGLVISRSGLEAQVHNAVGVIDAGYQGEIFVRLRNPRSQRIVVKSKERIVQLVLMPLAKFFLSPVTEFTETTDRGENGCHSTGKL